MSRMIAMILARMISVPILLIWRLMGWRAEGDLPERDKFILIAAPHTSNWDYIMMIALSAHYGRRPKTLVKANAFKWPIIGQIIRWIGGIPVERKASTNFVQQAIDIINAHDRIVLVIAPEATRKRADYWRSGFYHIGYGAGVPIVLGYLDYQRKVGAAGPAFTPTGDVEADIQEIAAFYAEHGHGKFPERATPVRFAPRPALQPEQETPASDQA